MDLRLPTDLRPDRREPCDPGAHGEAERALAGHGGAHERTGAGGIGPGDHATQSPVLVLVRTQCLYNLIINSVSIRQAAYEWTVLSYAQQLAEHEGLDVKQIERIVYG